MALVDWLATPLSGSDSHVIAPWAVWHARTMVLAWGLLIPLGALLARYFKVTPSQRWPAELDNKSWWHGHRALQWTGVVVMTVGAALAWGEGHGASPGARLHAVVGWLVVAIGWFQIASGLARGTKGGPTAEAMRGDHYDMTRHRVWFERLHKSLGWLSVLAAVVATALGLVAADAPRWMPLVLALWWIALASAAWHWQRSARCIDTYQAIWGPDPRHPGNRRAPIGWGVHRPAITTMPLSSTLSTSSTSSTSPVAPAALADDAR
jgi:hypothetical protein